MKRLLKKFKIVKQKCSGFGGYSVDRVQRVTLTIFKKKKIEHKILNAKFHEKEAEIIAQAEDLIR